MILRIATYNIQYGVGQDGRYDLGRIAEALGDRDIICLQEVTTAWLRCGEDDQPSILARLLNRYGVYAAAYDLDASRVEADGSVVNRRRGFGNMVLSRWPILYSRPHSLPRPFTEVPAEFHPRADFPRTALEAVVDCGGWPLRVFSIHLSHLPGAQRRMQIDALKDLVASLPEEAPLWDADPHLSAWSEDRPAPSRPRSTMLLGDFNFEPDDPDYARMLDPVDGQAGGLIDGWSAAKEQGSENRTFVENDGRLSRLDYLFATSDLRARILTARVDGTTKASDHFPLFFTVEA